MSGARALRSTRIDGAAARPIILKSILDAQSFAQAVAWGCRFLSADWFVLDTLLAHCYALVIAEYIQIVCRR
jgi:hypothetical protein